VLVADPGIVRQAMPKQNPLSSGATFYSIEIKQRMPKSHIYQFNVTATPIRARVPIIPTSNKHHNLCGWCGLLEKKKRGNKG
jgi:hypothetical protein